MEARFLVALITLIIYIASCISIGMVINKLTRRLTWRKWISALSIFVSGFIWPLILVSYFTYDASNYLKTHPRDDAPGLVLYGIITLVAPFVFFLGIIIMTIGYFIAPRLGQQSVKNEKRA